MAFWDRFLSPEEQARKAIILRYEACRPRIDNLHLRFAGEAYNTLKAVHGSINFIVSRSSSTFFAYAPDTKIFVSGNTAKKILPYPPDIDVNSPEISIEDIQRATYRYENLPSQLVASLGRQYHFGYKDEMKTRGYESREIPLHWVSSIYITKNKKRIAYAAPGANDALLKMPGTVYDSLRHGYPGRGEISSIEIEISYSTEYTQSLGETQRLLFLYEDFSSVKTAANDRYLATFSDNIIPFLRSLTTAMRHWEYEDFIIDYSGRWMKDPDPRPHVADPDNLPPF